MLVGGRDGSGRSIALLSVTSQYGMVAPRHLYNLYNGGTATHRVQRRGPHRVNPNNQRS